LNSKHSSHKVSTIKKAVKVVQKRILEHTKIKEAFKEKLLMKKASLEYEK